MQSQPQNLKSKITLAAICAILVLAVCLLMRTDREPVHGYAGSRSCRECHEDFYQRWESSHHGKAMQPVTPEMVSASLTPPDAPIIISNVTYTVDLVRRRVIEAPTERMKTQGNALTPSSFLPTTYPMRYALGGKNVFYFLTLLDKGKLQVLPVAYDVNTKSWFSTTDSAVRHFAEVRDTPLDWRDPMLTFNTACFGCHVSQLEKNYDPQRGTYRTTWREAGISCETCHGPAEAHVKAFRNHAKSQKKKNTASETLELQNFRTLELPLHLKSWRTFTPSQVNSACATCHAKMYPITHAFVPGDDFFDHYGLICLEDRDFAADGRDLGENYTYTHWLMNPCAKDGKLDCTHCHTSSGRYRFAPNVTNDVNAACTSCHAKDITAHSHHPAKKITPNSELRTPNCISCHAPSTTFAAMRRSDHSHRPPCPEASERFGAPSACVLCHTDKDEPWAAKYVRTWFPDNTRRAKMLREGGLIESARKQSGGGIPAAEISAILTYLSEPDAEPVVCASLLRLLPGCPDPQVWAVARAALTHASPLVRSSAAPLLADNLRDNASVAALCRALTDPVRLVRVQAAQALAAYPRNAFDPETLKRLTSAEAELTEMFNARPDDWASHYNTGNYRLARGDAKGAMTAYQESMKLRNDTVMPHVNAAVLASQNGDLHEAIGYLRTAFNASPKHGAVNLNLGLALAETGDLQYAEKHLRIAMDDPTCRAQAAFNCAVIIGPRDPKAAAELCREALKLDPDNSRYREALNYYLSRQK